MKWLKKVGLLFLVCFFLLSSMIYAQSGGYFVVFPDNIEKIKKFDGIKFQVENKTSQLKIVGPNETVKIELKMDELGKQPIKRTKVLRPLKEEITKQKLGEKIKKEIEIRITIDDEIGLTQEEFINKYAEIFANAEVDLSKRQASFFAKLHIEQIEALEKLEEVKYLTTTDDFLTTYGEIEMQQITPFLNESTDFTGIKMARSHYSVDGNRDGNPTSYSKDDVVIAIVDTGIDGNHVDLDGGKIIGWKDFVNPSTTAPYDNLWHGTHVASIAAGTGEGDSVSKGVAPGAALVGVRVCEASNLCSRDNILNAMDWLINNKDIFGIDIINLSLGAPGNVDMEFCEKVDIARQHGILTVVAAGNSPGGAEYGSLNKLAKCDNVISAGNMVDPMKGGWYLNPMSNRGSGSKGPTLVAPGTGIKAAKSNSTNEYLIASGTSMSSPFVAGLAALMLDASNGSLSYHFETEGFGKAGYDKVYGHGLVLGHDTVKKAAGATWGFYDDEREHITAHNNTSSYTIQFYEIKVDNLGPFFASTLIIHEEGGQDLDLYIWEPGVSPIQNGYLRNDLAVGSGTSLLPQERISFMPSSIGVYTIGVVAYDDASYSIDWSGQISVP